MIYSWILSREILLGKNYPVVENPVTSDYWKLNKRIYHVSFASNIIYPIIFNENLCQVSLAFDAAYCFLLRTIETLWYVDKEDSRHKLVLGNLFSVMMGVLKPLAQFLITKSIGKYGRRAAPCFGYYGRVGTQTATG